MIAIRQLITLSIMKKESGEEEEWIQGIHGEADVKELGHDGDDPERQPWSSP